MKEMMHSKSKLQRWWAIAERELWHVREIERTLISYRLECLDAIAKLENLKNK